MSGNDQSLIDFRIRPPRRDSEDDAPVALPEDMRRYDELYNMAELANVTFDSLVAEMEAHSVRGIMQAEFEHGSSEDCNRRVADLVRRRPDLFLGGIATADPRKVDAIEELRWAHDELGLRGLVLQPGFLRVEATDPRCFPLYEYCAAQGVPVTIHTGVNFSTTGPISYGRPLAVDEVACRFPGLTIVCNHGGWPWVTEAIAVAWKHRTVYLEFGAIAPRYLADPLGGWYPLKHWMNSQLRDKILLGSDWPMLRYDRLVRELPLLELRSDVLFGYVRGNAEQIIRKTWRSEIPEPETTGVSNLEGVSDDG